MTEILYTMKNGKIFDPNIPMDGLVCYLDARGKKNTDVHRGTLLDLSGNGNDGILTGFDFTEESGYVKDLLGGLQFKGVDDFINLDVLNGLSEYTLYSQMNVSDSNQNNSTYINSSDFIVYKNNNHNRVMLQLGNYENDTATWIEHDRTDVDRVLITRNGSDLKIQLDDKYYLVKNLIIPLTSDNIQFGSIGMTSGRNGELLLKKALFWNRALTDTEINQLLGA